MALDGEIELLLERDGELGADLFELLDGCGDGGLGTENLFLLLVEGFALGKGLFHLEDAIVFLPKGAKALVNEAKDGAVGRFGCHRVSHYVEL